MAPQDKALILIPAYNEAGRIASVIKECKKLFKNIIVIEDGSIDSTLKEAIKSKPSLILKHCINCGQGTAISTGIRYFLEKTDLEYLVTFDADGQHLTENAISMFQYAIENNFDAVFGSRFLTKYNLEEIPRIKLITLSFAKLFQRLFYGITLSDAHNGLRILNRKACINLSRLDSSSMANGTEITVKLIEAGINIKEYPCKVLYNRNTKLSQSPLASLNIISDLIQKK